MCLFPTSSRPGRESTRATPTRRRSRSRARAPRPLSHGRRAFTPAGIPLGAELGRRLAGGGGEKKKAGARAQASRRREFADAVLEDVLQALEFAHSKSVAHTDIRADNVVWADGRAVLVDCALSKRRPPRRAAVPAAAADADADADSLICADLRAAVALWVTLIFGPLRRTGDSVVSGFVAPPWTVRAPGASPESEEPFPALVDPVAAASEAMEWWVAERSPGEKPGSALHVLADEVLPALRAPAPAAAGSSRPELYGLLRGRLLARRGGGRGSGRGGGAPTAAAAPAALLGPGCAAAGGRREARLRGSQDRMSKVSARVHPD